MDKLDKFSPGRIRLRLFIFVLLVLIPIYGLVIYQNFSERQDSIDQAYNDTSRIVSLAVLEHDQYVDSASQLLIALSELDEVKNQNAYRCNTLFEEILNKYTIYANLGATDRDGDIYCSGLALEAPVNIKDRLYFRNAVNSSGFGVGEYQIGRVTNVASINFGYPVIDSANNIDGIVYAALDLNILNRFVSDGGTEQSLLTVVDKNGLVLVRSADSNQFIGTSAPDSSFLAEVISENGSGSGEGVGIDGVDRFYSYSPLERNGEKVAFVFVGFEKEALFSGANEKFITNSTYLLIVTILAFILSWFSGNFLIVQRVNALREVDKAKDSFISLASHQLKTPPTAVAWNAEIIEDEIKNLSDSQKKALKNIKNQSNKMVEIVNALLDTSRLELGTFIVSPKQVDFIKISKNIVEEFSKPIKEKQLNIVEEYDEKIPLIPADPALSKIILENLISNAIKYTPDEGTITISIKRNKEGELAGKSILIKVADTGYGIPKDQQSKIFSKMFRADNIRSVVDDGTGLGLFILKSIVDFSGGTVWFESEENKGTTFYIVLPYEGMKAKEGTSKVSYKG